MLRPYLFNNRGGFEMASKKQGMKVRAKAAKANKREGIDQGKIKAMANAMRVQLLTIFNERVSSATSIGRELGVEPSELQYDIEVLRTLGYIEIVEEKKRRGAVEVFYKATERAYLDEHEWPTVPEPLRSGLRASLLKSIMDDATIAIAEDTYDSLKEAHMSWTPLLVDLEGWERLTEILREALDEVLAVSQESAVRLATKDVEGMSCTISMLGYRAAIEDRKVGPPTTPEELKGKGKGKESRGGRTRRKK